MMIIHKLVGSDVTTLSIPVGSYCITITFGKLTPNLCRRRQDTGHTLYRIPLIIRTKNILLKCWVLSIEFC